MKLRHWITAILLLFLVAAALAGLFWTRELPGAEDAGAANSKKTPGAKLHTPARKLVDLTPLQTAKRMGALAGTPNEQALAHAAEKTADHEVDLSFFDAIRTAEENPPKLSPEAKEIEARKTKAQQAVKGDQDTIALLTGKMTGASQSQKDRLQDQVDVVKAQMELDQDELDDAAEDLEQAGGDPQSKIKRLQAEHEAGDHNAAEPVGSAVNPHERDYDAHTLADVFRAWLALRDKIAQLAAARQEAEQKQQRLTGRHVMLEAQVQQDKQNREAAKQQAVSFAQSGKAANIEESKAGATATLESLKQFTRDQKNLADLGRRIQDQQDLSDTYSSWIELIETRKRAALHRIDEGLLWILLVIFAVYLADRLIEHLFKGISAENKRIGTLRAVVKFAAQAVGAIVILFIVLGMPTQATTVLGLAGAGLTVAMKDFIIAFFGWFVLMGRNGIRVGDWIEINGVSGEVIEIGLLKTVLLETGNWTDASHPTGRRVSFVNSFAIEGHFFNFTTSGQWMWDELQLSIPASQDPYPMIDGLQRIVEQETAANARKAEAEWRETTTRYRAKSLSAVPGINVRPTGSGVEVRVRYITRVYERHETRKRLYHSMVELMHGKREAVRA